jgi:uncharacterized protein DUF4232
VRPPAAVRVALVPVLILLLLFVACSAGFAAAQREETLPACAGAALDVWLETPGDGTAGSVYYRLDFTNLGSQTCTLSGYPGVSAVSLGGTQLGSAAARESAVGAGTVRLAGGVTATDLLRITDVLNYPRSACRPATAAGLRVYAPGSRSARVVPFPFSACTRTGVPFLHVRAVQPSSSVPRP